MEIILAVVVFFFWKSELVIFNPAYIHIIFRERKKRGRGSGKHLVFEFSFYSTMIGETSTLRNKKTNVG